MTREVTIYRLDGEDGSSVSFHATKKEATAEVRYYVASTPTGVRPSPDRAARVIGTGDA